MHALRDSSSQYPVLDPLSQTDRVICKGATWWCKQWCAWRARCQQFTVCCNPLCRGKRTQRPSDSGSRSHALIICNSGSRSNSPSFVIRRVTVICAANYCCGPMRKGLALWLPLDQTHLLRKFQNEFAQFGWHLAVESEGAGPSTGCKPTDQLRHDARK